MVKLEKISKQFTTASDRPFVALKNIDLAIERGEFAAIIGRSGSGKSTLLNLVAGLDQPSKGTVSIDDNVLSGLTENDLALWRGRNVGIVFQFFQLLPTLTIQENLLIAMDFVDVVPKKDRLEVCKKLLEKLDIADQADKLPATLSGGQQQRAAIARSLVNDPPLIIADEPTGNLDTVAGNKIIEIFQSLSTEDGKTVLFVTHDMELAKLAGRLINIHDGQILEDTRKAKVE